MATCPGDGWHEWHDRVPPPYLPSKILLKVEPVFNNLDCIFTHCEGRGTLVCGGAALSTHAMFADDTTLFASSRASLVRMIQDVKLALSDHGLNLNIDKCNAR